MEQKNIKENKTTYKLFIIMAMSTAILLVSPVLLLAALGYFLDKFFHTAPLFLIIGGVIGFISGITNVFRMMRLMQRRKRQKINDNLNK
jgi:F0F1-type ATP synthase assembly protein I